MPEVITIKSVVISKLDKGFLLAASCSLGGDIETQEAHTDLDQVLESVDLLLRTKPACVKACVKGDENDRGTVLQDDNRRELEEIAKQIAEKYATIESAPATELVHGFRFPLSDEDRQGAIDFLAKFNVTVPPRTRKSTIEQMLRDLDTSKPVTAPEVVDNTPPQAPGQTDMFEDELPSTPAAVATPAPMPEESDKCLLCEGSGRLGSTPCAKCEGTGKNTKPLTQADLRLLGKSLIEFQKDSPARKIAVTEGLNAALKKLGASSVAVIPEDKLAAAATMFRVEASAALAALDRAPKLKAEFGHEFLS